QVPTTQQTTASSLTWRATFSEPVNGVNAAGFTLTNLSGTVSGTVGTVTAVGGSATTYDIVGSSITGAGDIRLDLVGGGIQDLAGNVLTGNFTGGQTYTFTPIPPTLSAVAIASNNSNTALAKPGNLVTLSFTASQTIQSPLVTIATHSVTATAG